MRITRATVEESNGLSEMKSSVELPSFLFIQIGEEKENPAARKEKKRIICGGWAAAAARAGFPHRKKKIWIGHHKRVTEQKIAYARRGKSYVCMGAKGKSCAWSQTRRPTLTCRDERGEEDSPFFLSEEETRRATDGKHALGPMYSTNFCLDVHVTRLHQHPLCLFFSPLFPFSLCLLARINALTKWCNHIFIIPFKCSLFFFPFLFFPLLIWLGTLAWPRLTGTVTDGAPVGISYIFLLSSAFVVAFHTQFINN